MCFLVDLQAAFQSGTVWFSSRFLLQLPLLLLTVILAGSVYGGVGSVCALVCSSWHHQAHPCLGLVLPEIAESVIPCTHPSPLLPVSLLRIVDVIGILKYYIVLHLDVCVVVLIIAVSFLLVYRSRLMA